MQPWTRVQRKVRNVFQTAIHHGKTRYAPVRRAGRRLLMHSGLPLQKEFLVLPCMTGADTSGLFTEFLAVVGALAQHERWSSIYAGLAVDYADQGLYYDAAHGDNWWQYYFEPIDVGRRAGARVVTIDPHQHDLLTYQAAAMRRHDAHAVIARHIHLRPALEQAVQQYVDRNFGGVRTIGVHYRGTDKSEEAPRVPYDVVAQAVADAGAGHGHAWRVYLATDEEACVDYMRERFGDRLLYRAIFRSRDGRPIDVVNSDRNFTKGADAVWDCVLLSRASCLIRTASNLGLCAAFFNPSIPEVLLNRPYYQPT
jgi:hypothetical protein